MRLDKYLTEKYIAETRSKASQLIQSSCVFVNGNAVTKNGYEVKENDTVEVKENQVLEYVSRGGHKLERALDCFSLSFEGKIICDIGSSTGGFTDCSLKRGARRVYAVDVGTSQLHPLLREDERVVVLENTNFRYIDKSVLRDPIDFYVCDVSFISIREIIDTLLSFQENFSLVMLFKPQFEVGKGKLNKRGVVKSDEDLLTSLKDFDCYLKAKKIGILGVTYSPILGNKEGNMEFLFYLEKGKRSVSVDYEDVLREALSFFHR